MYAIERGIHVLVTKPATQLLSHHNELIEAAKKHNVVCFVEHHKRFDPVYSDAKARAQALGEFNFFNAWMSQPKSQLETFRAWAGKDSDIRLEPITLIQIQLTPGTFVNHSLTATIFLRITSTFAAGFCKIKQYLPGWLRVLRLALPPGSLTIACLKQKTQ